MRGMSHLRRIVGNPAASSAVEIEHFRSDRVEIAWSRKHVDSQLRRHQRVACSWARRACDDIWQHRLMQPRDALLLKEALLHLCRAAGEPFLTYCQLDRVHQAVGRSVRAHAIRGQRPQGAQRGGRSWRRIEQHQRDSWGLRRVRERQPRVGVHLHVFSACVQPPAKAAARAEPTHENHRRQSGSRNCMTPVQARERKSR
jgi:hypothetical protein